MSTSPFESDIDPFDLVGKNPRRVAPAVRKNIQIQRVRIRAAWVSGILCMLIGIAGVVVDWIPVLVSVVCFLMVPFSILGVVCDGHILKYQKGRLAECERRIQAGRKVK